MLSSSSSASAPSRAALPAERPRKLRRKAAQNVRTSPGDAAPSPLDRLLQPSAKERRAVARADRLRPANLLRGLGWAGLTGLAGVGIYQVVQWAGGAAGAGAAATTGAAVGTHGAPVALIVGVTVAATLCLAVLTLVAYQAIKRRQQGAQAKALRLAQARAAAMMGQAPASPQAPPA